MRVGSPELNDSDAPVNLQIRIYESNMIAPDKSRLLSQTCGFTIETGLKAVCRSLKEINRGSRSLKGSPSPKIAMHLRLAVQPRTAQVASHFGRDARPDRPTSHFLDALAFMQSCAVACSSPCSVSANEVVESSLISCMVLSK